MGEGDWGTPKEGEVGEEDDDDDDDDDDHRGGQGAWLRPPPSPMVVVVRSKEEEVRIPRGENQLIIGGRRTVARYREEARWEGGEPVPAPSAKAWQFLQAFGPPPTPPPPREISGRLQ